MAGGLRDSDDFDVAWENYRRGGGALGDAQLRALAEAHAAVGGAETAYAVYTRLKGRVGEAAVVAVEGWFLTNYLPARGGFQNAVLMLLSLKEGKGRDSPRLGDSHRAAVADFCESFYEQRGRIEADFKRLHDAAKKEGPTPWEAVLQTFPADSRAGGNFPWLMRVRDSLVYQVFRREWAVLCERLGEGTAERLEDWLRKEGMHPQS